jgi:hypothetical protein
MDAPSGTAGRPTAAARSRTSLSAFVFASLALVHCSSDSDLDVRADPRRWSRRIRLLRNGWRVGAAGLQTSALIRPRSRSASSVLRTRHTRPSESPRRMERARNRLRERLPDGSIRQVRERVRDPLRVRRRDADVHMRLGHRRHRERVRESVIGARDLPQDAVTGRCSRGPGTKTGHRVSV